MRHVADPADPTRPVSSAGEKDPAGGGARPSGAGSLLPTADGDRPDQGIPDARLAAAAGARRLARLTVNGATLYGDPSGAAYWPARRTLFVADLHLEKGSGLAQRGVGLLPPFDSRETLARLAALVDLYQPDRLVSLGDSFHDGDAGARLGQEDGQELASLTAACDWVWIVGNHDPAPPQTWGGRIVPDLVDAPLVCRHEAEPGRPAGEVSGHFHPKARVATRGRAVTGRCFVTDGRRLILPSFGAYTGGLDVTMPAISRLFPTGFTAHLIGRNRIFAFRSTVLSERGSR